MDMSVRIGVIGCGLIGHKRAKSFGIAGHVAAAADIDLGRAQKLAASYPGCVATNDWRAVVADPNIDAVVIATTNDSLAELTIAAVRGGKHVLVEKPAARNTAEIESLVDEARRLGRVVKVGFNHRFHPAFRKAREIFDSGELGPLMFIRGRYGHGGRIGYDREWRADPVMAGGGEMLDQGVHLIDLARWFAGDFSDVSGHVITSYWDMPVEDNGFASLRTADGVTAWLHASCTEWKNMFSFEIYGRGGKLQIDGLGGSYGVERLSYYKMLPQMGPPETTIWEYPGDDSSWTAEYTHFVDCIERGTEPLGSLRDAVAALDVVEQIYGLSGCSWVSSPRKAA